MQRIILVYGIIGGIIVAAGMLLSINLVPTGGAAGMVAGYLSMFVALSTVFVGIKRYRDVEGGGIIRFWPAFGLGLAISGIAGLIYVLGWEVYMWATDYSFMDVYVAQSVAEMRTGGASAAEITKFEREMEGFKANYANPLYRMPMTFTEMTPVGLVVSLVSAAVLRNSRVLPAAT